MMDSLGEDNSIYLLHWPTAAFSCCRFFFEQYHPTIISRLQIWYDTFLKSCQQQFINIPTCHVQQLLQHLENSNSSNTYLLREPSTDTNWWHKAKRLHISLSCKRIHSMNIIYIWNCDSSSDCFISKNITAECCNYISQLETSCYIIFLNA